VRKAIKKYLVGLGSFTKFVGLLKAYMSYLKDPLVTYHGEPNQVRGTIMAFVIRCNDGISFNDELPNNDLLVIVEYVSEDNTNIYTFNVTADPKSKKANIAHLLEQVYVGNVRPHRWIAGRLAICSDNGCWFRRTDTVGRDGDFTFDKIGINIHDTGGFWNSSLGCVILESDDEYKNVFKPLLRRVINKNSIPVAVINQRYFKEELGLKEI
jgi:hypothetical protein